MIGHLGLVDGDRPGVGGIQDMAGWKAVKVAASATGFRPGLVIDAIGLHDRVWLDESPGRGA